jgi:2-polyprenyl-6-hydroxyphenyl methylase/3-demethylubiquinone-9 3-methyltransferase
MSKHSNEQFLKYTLSTQQIDDAKLSAFASHHDAIKREMQRRGTWRPGLRFLDVGCGLGLYSEFWHSQGFRVTGLDLSQATLVIARERAISAHYPIHYVLGSASDLPLASGSFDVIFAHALLEHVPDWQHCLTEFVRLLAPGGLLWIQTTNVICPYQREYRWLPIYSWWPRPIKRIAEGLARGPLPALANYTPFPAVNWFSYFQLRRFLGQRGLLISDRFDCMRIDQAATIKRVVRTFAMSGDVGRWVSYLSVEALIVLATRPAGAR